MDAIFTKPAVEQVEPTDESCTDLEQSLHRLSLEMGNDEHIVWNKDNPDHPRNWPMRRKVFDVGINIVYNCIASASPTFFPCTWRLTEMEISITLSTAAVCITHFEVLLCVLPCSRRQLASKQLKIFILAPVFRSSPSCQCELVTNGTFKSISHNLPGT